MAVDQALLKTMEWRMIGPPRGGRVVAVAGDPSEPATFYFGACGGGVWKSTDGGTYWENVSDGFFKTAPVGALAVADADPNVIYAGTGEACIRGNVIHGDGVYRSTDAGRSWQHLGLADTRHISRVRVHPNDPDTVYVAALGHAFGPNKERGVFRSQDGGKSWQQSLFVSERAGAADLSMDPHNPRLLFTAIWQANPHAVDAGERRAGLRHLPLDRRRRKLARPLRPAGVAEGDQGPHRRRRLAGEGGPRLGDRRGGRRGPPPLGGRGRNLAAAERGP